MATQSPTRRTAKSFCRNCGALCSMELTVQGNQLITATGDGSVSPYGGYMCVKGLASIDFHNGSEDRLVHSLKREPTGRHVETSSAQAMDEIASKLRQLIAEHGPRSVAFFHGTGAYRSVLGGLLERAFASKIGSPNFFSTMTIDQSAKWVTAGRMGVMTSGKPSTRDIDLAVIVGNNPLVSHQTYPFAAGESGSPGRAFAEAKARGARIVVIDPRRTETARYADLLIQPLPGHDAALFAGIAHILLRDGTFNRSFCERFVTQLDVLRAAIAPFTPERVAQRADVPVEHIELLARWLSEARRPFVGSGSGPSMSAHSNLNDHMIETVNALIGGYRRAGDLVRNPGTLKPRVIVESVANATRSWEKGAKCRTADIGTLYGELPTALLPREILQPGPDKIRALIVFGGNPVMALGDPDHAIPAFDRSPDPEDLIGYLCSHGDVTFEELKANPSGIRPNRPARYVQPTEDNGARLQLCPPDVAEELWLIDSETPETGFKYRLTCRRVLEAMNSAYRDASRTKKKYPVNWAYMNPDDMIADGIAENALIEIRSESGCILGVAKADPRLRRGVLSMTHLYGSLEPSADPIRQRGSHTGRLTSLRHHLEPINFMPRFSGIPVNVTPSAGPSPQPDR